MTVQTKENDCSNVSNVTSLFFKLCFTYFTFLNLFFFKLSFILIKPWHILCSYIRILFKLLYFVWIVRFGWNCHFINEVLFHFPNLNLILYNFRVRVRVRVNYYIIIIFLQLQLFFLWHLLIKMIFNGCICFYLNCYFMFFEKVLLFSNCCFISFEQKLHLNCQSTI